MSIKPAAARSARMTPAGPVQLQQALPLFFAFAFAYLFSALLRGVMATLAPVFSVELGLTAADLGLLAGAFFLGFAALQLPLGRALDRFGPRATLLWLLAVAVVGCTAFAAARNLPELFAARLLIGAGMAACLMAPLTCFAARLMPAAQLRANSWLLMTGSLGMLSSTVPVQWLLPLWGWRGLFVALALGLLIAMALVAWRVPGGAAMVRPGDDAGQGGQTSYAAIVRHPLFVRLAPLGFFVYGGMIAVQSLWAGPWLTRLGGVTAAQSAQGLFFINLAMLFAFMVWGAVMPRLVQRDVGPLVLLTFGIPASLLVLAWNVVAGGEAGAGHWAVWCVVCSFVTLSQPAVGQAFPVAQAGRALSAFNLVIFSGVFSVQWGIGLAIDALRAVSVSETVAFQMAFSAFGVCCLASYAWFLQRAPERS